MELCPNQDFIDQQNSLVKIVRNNWIDGENVLRGIDTQSEIIDVSEILANHEGCLLCDGVTVDFATGNVYCGLDTPLEVLESNKRIQAS